MLSVLHLSAGPVPVRALHDLLGSASPNCAPSAARSPTARSTSTSPEPSRDRPRELRRRPLAPLLDWALDALAAVGALTYGDGHATLTPLGNWAVWVKLEQICVAAQSPAGNIEQPAEDMLRGCARLTPGPARAEYRAWLAARPVGSAVTELLGAARGEDALIRGLAFEALRVVGAPAEPEVRAVAEEPTLRPYALLWLAEHEGADPEDAARGRSPGRRRPGCGSTPPPPSPTTVNSGCSCATWSRRCSARSPSCWRRCVPSATRAPCRCWSRSPPPTRTPRSPRPYAARPSRCTPGR